MEMMEPIKLYWWTHAKWNTNFGDILSPYIVQKLSGRSVIRSTGRAKLVACGSVMPHVRSEDKVWGTGIMFSREPCDKIADFIAVRGPMTWKRILHKNTDCPIYGDAAIVLPEILPAVYKKKYEIGILPHYIDFSRVFKEVDKDPNVKVIDIMSGIENVVKEMNQCHYIYTSSLHGIIVAEAYGLNVNWVKWSEKIAGNDFKFHDYFASTQREGVSYIDWKNDTILSGKHRQLPKSYWTNDDTTKLLKSFPYLREDLK
jgi:pyruvyltransferase